MIHLRRLLKGIIYVCVTFLFFLNSEEIFDNFWSYLIDNGYNNSWLEVAKSIYVPAIGFFFVGLYFIFSFHLERNPVFERSWKEYLLDFTRSSGPTPQSMQTTSNISKMQQYRDSVLATQSNSDGAKEYMKTAWIDGLTNNAGEHTNTVKQYIDSKLSSMSNNDGYEWAKSQSSK